MRSRAILSVSLNVLQTGAAPDCIQDFYWRENLYKIIDDTAYT